MTTRVKAKSVFVMLKEKARPSYDVKFAASSGWFKEVKNHLLSHNGKGSADVKADGEFLETLGEMTVKENYLSEQIFNINGSSLFWKWMPEGTLSFIMRPSQCQVSRFLRTGYQPSLGVMLQATN